MTTTNPGGASRLLKSDVLSRRSVRSDGRDFAFQQPPSAAKPPAQPRIGAQVSTAGGFAPVPERAHALGAEVVQVFCSNPRMWRARVPDQVEMDAFTVGLRRYRLPLFLHTIYMINMATPDEELRRRSADALAYSLTLGAIAGATGVVTHLGSHRGEGPAKGRQWAAGAINEAVQTAARSLEGLAGGVHLPPLLLETGTGSGHGLGGRLEDLAGVLALLRAQADTKMFGVCIDTAHLFAAGYPIHEAEGLETVLGLLAELQLLDSIELVHLNDSAAQFGSKWDRHENPGDGQIGYEGLARVVRHPSLAHLPFALETPGLEGHGPDSVNVAVVKAMRAGKLAKTAAKPLGRPFKGVA